MKIPLTLFPEWIVEQYNLTQHALHDCVHLEMRKAVRGLPQAGILTNKCLRKKLAPFGYYKSTNTSGLWLHKTRPILFTLVVDDFRVKYVNSDDVQHLIVSIKKNHSLTKDWTGDLYCGIKLEWDHVNRAVDTLMPGYVKNELQELGHIKPKNPQTYPYSPEPKKFGTEAQAPLPTDISPKLDAKGIKSVQQIVGSILYYARAINMTVLKALSSIAVEQTKASDKTIARCTQLLDYLSHSADAKVCFHASNMILNIHSNAS
jgi:hypothetical protein